MTKKTTLTMRTLGMLAILLGAFIQWYWHNATTAIGVHWYEDYRIGVLCTVAFLAMSALYILCFIVLLADCWRTTLTKKTALTMRILGVLTILLGAFSQWWWYKGEFSFGGVYWPLLYRFVPYCSVAFFTISALYILCYIVLLADCSMFTMTKGTAKTMRILGGLAITFGAYGLWYNLTAPFGTRWNVPGMFGPHFGVAYCIMSAGSIVCHIVLLVAGIQLVRLRRDGLRAFIAVLAVEVMFLTAVTVVGMHYDPAVQFSIGAASDSLLIMNLQLLTLFPVWGIVWAIRIARREVELHDYWWLWAIVPSTILIALIWRCFAGAVIGWWGFALGFVASLIAWGLRPARGDASPEAPRIE